LQIKKQLSDDKLITEILEGKTSDPLKFWDHISAILALTEKHYPEEVRAAEMGAWNHRQKSINKFGESTKGLGSRFLCTIPERIELIISLIYGDNYEETPYKSKKEFLRAFARKFSQFSIPNKI
jgi:hypothetical protein